MSRADAPADGYLIEHSEEGQTFMLGFRSPSGFRTAVFTHREAEDLAKRLGNIYGRDFVVVPAPATP